MSRLAAPLPPMKPLLAIVEVGDDAAPLLAALRSAGQTPVEVGTCLTLVHQAHSLAPRQVVCHLPRGVATLLKAMDVWVGMPPCPITVISPMATEAELRALVDAGVVGWALRLDAFDPALDLSFDQARFDREHALRSELARIRVQLDERKWVDRAKGLLMSARSIGEEAAFGLLRGAAMHANLKLGDVARAVIDAARWAEAVNRAGQLRMLSQRTVALAAQRLARVEGSGARATQATKRAQANIDHLTTLGLEDEGAAALAAVAAAWVDLKPRLAGKPSAVTLAQADICAQALLLAAERLTESLEAHGARRALRIVNLCGRQRMRAQRLAKDAFLSTLLPQLGTALRMQQTMDEFEQAQAEIEAAPLSSPEIRAALSAAREGWLVLLRALRSGDAALLAHASEALLDSLDGLTESCERSLQLLMS